MARGNVHVVGLSVLLILGAQLMLDKARVEAFIIIFSPDVTTDFIKGGINVSSIVQKDWATLPQKGTCGLSNKNGIQHVFNGTTTGVRGILHVTFEYLTSDCTAEYNRDTNLCSTLTAAFSVCAGFPSDPRTTQRPWGYCSNFNFRVSYLWVPNEGFTNTTSNSQLISTNSLAATSDSAQLGSNYIDPTDPEALAAINKDVDTLNRVAKGWTEASGLTATACNWKFSNIVPVAWDGIQNTMLAGQFLSSSDAGFQFVMQSDCNLVLYKRGFDGKYEWNALWATFTNYSDPFPRNCSLELQPTGNLLVLDPSGNTRWSSNHTASSGSLYSSALAVLMNGNVVVYELISGGIIWATGTNQTASAIAPPGIIS